MSRRVICFVQVNLLGAGLAWAVSSLMARLALPALGLDFHPFEVEHFVGVAAPAISSYFLRKHATFAWASRYAMSFATSTRLSRDQLSICD